MNNPTPRTAGIIMECNPFHDGHRYIIEHAKKECDRLIVVLSGDFVQRGEPAIVCKEVRTRQILQAGADLVLELPVCYACSGAEFFARGGITILHKLGIVSDLYFGFTGTDAFLRNADTDEIPEFPELSMMKTARFLNEESEEFKASIKACLANGMPYPSARSAALKETAGISIPTDGNDLLGVEYCRSLLKLGSKIKIHPVPRINTPSASEIRAEIFRKETSSGSVPENSETPFSSLKERNPVILHPYMSPDDFSQALLYQLHMDNNREIYADISHELSGRIDARLMEFSSFTEFCRLLKTRNYTYTRISRALLHILLQITKSDMLNYAEASDIGYVRVLGLRKESSALLRDIVRNCSVPVITRLSSAKISPPFDEMLKKDITASELYDSIAANKNIPGSTPVGEYRKELIKTAAEI